MEPLTVALGLLALALAGLLGHALGSTRRPPPSADPFAAARLQETLDRVARLQEQLRAESQRSREDALAGLAAAAQDLQGRLAQAQRAVAEVRAIEQARGVQLDRATDSLRRLEVVVAGSQSRGAAGEGVIARAFSPLPADMLERNAVFAGRVVEYALRLPGGRLLPVDSKWTGVAELERLETTDDAEERRRLRDHLAREVRRRAREMAGYVDHERTLGLAVLAVPDAVHGETAEAHAAAARDGVLVVPYSLALAVVLSIHRLSVRFAAVPAEAETAARLSRLAELLQRLDDEIDGRLSRALVQAANARDSLRSDVAEARRLCGRLAGFDRPEAQG